MLSARLHHYSIGYFEIASYLGLSLTVFPRVIQCIVQGNPTAITSKHIQTCPIKSAKTLKTPQTLEFSQNSNHLTSIYKKKTSNADLSRYKNSLPLILSSSQNLLRAFRLRTTHTTRPTQVSQLNASTYTH